jgi:hypothetical protein
MKDLVKQKIIELVPEPEGVNYACPRCSLYPNTLADVLRAIDEYGIAIRVDQNGTFWRVIRDEPFRDEDGASIWWNLTTDFDGQTDEVKTFIGSLIGA